MCGRRSEGISSKNDPKVVREGPPNRDGALVPWIFSVADGTGSRLILHTSVTEQLEPRSPVHEAGGSHGVRQVSQHASARRGLVLSNGLLTHRCGTQASTDTRLMKYAAQAKYCISPSEQIRLHWRCILRRPKKFFWHARGICRAILAMIRITSRVDRVCRMSAAARAVQKP
jgi:hypothetical protein